MAVDAQYQVPPFDVHVDGGHITLRGELDLATVDSFTEALATAADRGSARVVVDLRELEFLDSSGIGALVRAHAALGAERRALTVLATPASPIERALVVSGVHGLLDVQPS